VYKVIQVKSPIALHPIGYRLFQSSFSILVLSLFRWNQFSVDSGQFINCKVNKWDQFSYTAALQKTVMSSSSSGQFCIILAIPVFILVGKSYLNRMDWRWNTSSRMCLVILSSHPSQLVSRCDLVIQSRRTLTEMIDWSTSVHDKGDI